VKHIAAVLKINEENEIVQREEQFGRCTRCKEMTSIQDPCCVNVPIEYQGDLVLPTFEDDNATNTPII
jgi:hypothetical protein